MLKEPLKGYRIMIIIFMMTGVALITRPVFLGFPEDLQKYADNNQVLGYLACCMVPIMSAVVSIWTRQCKKVQASVVMFWVIKVLMKKREKFKVWPLIKNPHFLSNFHEAL